MKALVTALVLTASAAYAQGPGSEGFLVLVLGPPTLISVAMDVTLLSTLVPDGHAGRGRSITTTVFGGVSLITSLIALAAGLGSTVRDTTWMSISAGGLAFAIGTIVVSIYALLHPPPETEATPGREEKRSDEYEHLYRPAPPPPPAPVRPQDVPDQL